MKGLIRGIKYISHIFDEKEPEIQIGYPTDVKHVAHIGWDGPSASKPSWMDGFQSSPEISNPLEELNNLSTDKSQGEKTKRKSRRPSSGVDSPLNSPSRRSNDGSNSKHSRRQTTTCIGSPVHSPPKHSRRHRSSNNSLDSPSRDSPTRNTRRLQNSCLGVESPARDQPSIPRHSKGRKSKEPSKSKSKLKGQNSSADMLPSTDCVPEGSQTGENHLSSILEPNEEEV